MAQKGLMKFLSRKDGKNTVSDNKDNEKAKLTRVLEFIQARKPEQAKLGEVVRFMYYPGDGTAAYWMDARDVGTQVRQVQSSKKPPILQGLASK